MDEPPHSNQGVPPFIIEPSKPHTHSVILLHGLGSNGEKFGRELIETGLCSDGKSLLDLVPGARFIFPTSKRRRSSAFKRAMLTQWFDIASLEDPSYRSHTQYEGLEQSSREIFQLISEERAKVSEKNIILGGISQGCAMSLMCLLALDFPIGGFMGMSGWLPFARDIGKVAEENTEEHVSDDGDDPFEVFDDDSDPRDANAKVHDFVKELLALVSPERSKALGALSTPVFLGHGEVDEKIVPALGEQAYQVLRSTGFEVEWKSYEGQGHWYKIPDQIDDITKFIRERVGW
ncbi:related to lysophospholipase [Fusarium torulosum]|uniref:Related to lysophospholipase n=1 Tax=Fusarium torulosum TaxID=33205 RepID=A0AAE8MLS3_9HYPO|nr:related to lysophospholipase [Fusarium torulosum]